MEKPLVKRGPGIDKKLHALHRMGEIIYPLHGTAVEICKLIIDFISQFTGRMITYSCWD